MIVFTLSCSLTISAFGATTAVQNVNKFNPGQITLDDLMTLEQDMSEKPETPVSGEGNVAALENDLMALSKQVSTEGNLPDGMSVSKALGPINSLMQLYGRILDPVVFNELKKGNIPSLDYLIELDKQTPQSPELSNEIINDNMETSENNLMKLSQTGQSVEETSNELDATTNQLQQIMRSMQISLDDIIKS